MIIAGKGAQCDINDAYHKIVHVYFPAFLFEGSRIFCTFAGDNITIIQFFTDEKKVDDSSPHGTGTDGKSRKKYMDNLMMLPFTSRCAPLPAIIVLLTSIK